ncbi:AraC family transcriptional regulator [Pseudomonas aeruginosa]|nr:AraC family transcriptional regulator [Pseudomonas aeruginosa]
MQAGRAKYPATGWAQRTRRASPSPRCFESSQIPVMHNSNEPLDPLFPSQPDEADKTGTEPIDTANVVPSGARVLLGLIEERGLSPDEICRGLGFTYQELVRQDVSLSYKQMRLLIVRAQRMLGEPALGLTMGARETPISWGLPGLALLTCETYGEAVKYGLGHQQSIGALLIHLAEIRGREIRMEVRPKWFDLQIETVLVEEAFASVVAVSRCLLGSSFNPLRVDFAFQRPADEEIYRRFFHCPVRFEAGINRLTIDTHWLGARLPGYDRITSRMVREKLNTLLPIPIGRNDLVESVANRMRTGIEEHRSQKELAQMVNVSDRTLRRRLSHQEVTYRGMRDEARYERARELLANSSMNIAQIAEAVGYADARAFRRAFKRWSGSLPTEFRASRGLSG